MKVRVLAILIGLGALGAGAASTQEAGKPPAASEQSLPRWVKKPSGDDLGNAYPEMARRKGMSGRAVLECEVTAERALVNCAVVSESPASEGFGAAGLKVTRRFEIEPAKIGGVPQQTTVRFTIYFTVDGDDGIVNGVHWASAPTKARFDALRKELNGAAGEAEVACRILANGVLGKCDVLTEIPARKGIGAAAEALAHDFRVDMAAAPPGRSLNGLETVLKFTFDAPGEPPPPLKPGWVAAPTAEDLKFSAKARAAGLRKGIATVDCAITETGRLDDCRAVKEDPASGGFGEAALLLTPRFRMNPWSEDGRPVEGRRIRLPIGFVDDQPAAPAEPPAK